MPRSRSRSGSLDSLGRRRRRRHRRRDSPPTKYRRRRLSVSLSRSRSSSPDYKRHRDSGSRSRSRSRSIEPQRRHHRLRHRRSYSRSRSPMSRSQGRLSTGRSPTRRASITNERKTSWTKPTVDAAEVTLKLETNTMSHLSEEDQMKLLLGFGDFDSTKGKPVEENKKSAAMGTARRETKREYRQYMNRRGGFNRLLDKA